ncbi:MAG: PAS domain S-box protein [Chloroflexi bacterium]|nr:PAS domain S-box protein [Chloroflexota bacterium]
MNTRKTSHRNKAVPAPESEGGGSGKKIIERKQTAEALQCNYDFLLALSLAAQSVQQARTPEDIYHILGREIKALDCDLVIFTCSEDRKHLHVAYTTLAADLLHAAEKLTGLQTRDYLLPIQPKSTLAHVIDGGNAEFIHQTEAEAAQALPEILHPLAERLVTFLKVGRGIIAPLRVDATTVGVMAITGSNLEESNVPAVASFAAQAAISLKNVRLTRQLQEELEERKQTEEQLQLLKYSIDIAPDGAYWMDKDGRFLYANEAGCRALGYTNEELMQMRVSEVNPRATPERWSQVWREIKKKKSIEIRSVHRRKDGSEFPVELTSTYVEFGKREYCNGFAKDITERVQAEEKIKLSEARYRSLVETQSDLISRSDLSGNLSFVNDAYCRTFGVRREQAPGNNFISTVFSEDVPKILNVLEAIKHPPHRQYIEIRNITPDGMRWFGWDNSAVLDERQNIIELQGVGRDITERKQMEEMVRASEERHRTLVENMTDVVMEVDAQGNFCYISPNYETLTGYTLEEEFKGSAFAHVHPDDQPLLMQKLAKAFDSKQSMAYRVQNKSGEWRWIETFGKPYRAKDGSPHVICLARDITERKRTEEEIAASNRKWQITFDGMNDSVFLLDGEGLVLQANRASFELFGKKMEEIVGKYCYEVVHNDTCHIKNCPFVRMKQSKQREMMELQVGEKHFEVTVDPLLDTDGHLRGAVHIVNDITERKRVEEKLRESESQLREAQKMAHLGFWHWDIKTGDVEWSDEVFKIFGLDPKEFTPQIDSILALSPWPEDHQRDKELIDRAIETHGPGSYEQKFLRPDQSIGHYYSTFQGNYAENGDLISIVGTVLDITERKLAEEKLRESERTLSNFIANSPDTMYLLDLENHTSKYLNCEEFCGYPKSVLESPGSIMFALHPDDGPGVRANWQQMLRSVNDKVTSCEYRLQRKDGNWEWILQRMTILSRAVEDKPSRVLVTLSIITERKQAETKLKESEENFRLIAETIREVFYTYDPLADKFLYVSPAYETLWQEPVRKVYDDPRSFTHAVHTEDRERFFAAVQREREGGEYFNMQYRIVRPDGTMRHVHSRNYPVFDASGAEYRVVGIAEDITIRKRAEEEILKLNIELEQRVEDRTQELHQAQEQLVRQEKLAVLGQLAGSVGHELRNPLAVIKNALYYLKIVGANGNEKVREYLGIIESEARTAEKIINDLLEFARVKAVDTEVVPASRLVEYVLERHPAPGNVRVTVNIPSSLPMLYIDPRQMEQVIGNLFVNACQAMGSGGELVITAREEQGMVAIAVRDTGGGIPPENIGRLFEPLFTTKTKGIGLGLAVSRKLTEANGGRIEVQSEVGIGTTFTVYLPVKHDKHVEDNP